MKQAKNTMKVNYEAEAKRFCKAIKELAENQSSLDNLESYLSYHFDEWLKKFANTPENMASELQEFAKIG